MAEKGDKAKLYDVARRMYVDGGSLTDIAAALNVSRQALSTWKADTKRAGQELDEWDRARAQKSSSIQRLKDLFERQLEYVEGLSPNQVSSPMMDTLSKLGALVERWDKAETVLRRVSEIVRADDGSDTTGKMDAMMNAIRKLREEYGI